MSDAYAALARYSRSTATLEALKALAAWDQETYMPEAAAAGRAEQMAEIAAVVHARRTSDQMRRLLEAAEADAQVQGDERLKASVREYRRDFDRATKLPTSLVQALAQKGSEAQQIWKKARRDKDFQMFRPALQEVVRLTREKARCYGAPAGGELYDALIDEYEPNARAAEIEAVFTPLAERLSRLLRTLSAGAHPDESPIDITIPADRQHRFGLFVIEKLGFAMDAGRLDTTTHPFCEGVAPGDTRLTTRYHDERFTDALYGTMHECGHGLYEQGVPKARHFGEPLGESVSLGIHESQSRLWENFVGRSLAFWKWALPHARELLGEALAPYGPEDLYRATNTARPSFVRVEADEATYNLHVMIRFEIERAMFSGDLEVQAIPEVWNQRYEQYLGLKVPDDSKGCLQDVHWSFGLIGYFPTYTLGNLYAAQFFEKAQEELGDLDSQIASGEFAPLLAWMREKIHAHGRRFTPAELCQRITAKPLSADPLMRHLEGKLLPIYGV